MNKSIFHICKNYIPQIFCALILIVVLISSISIANKYPTDYVEDPINCQLYTKEFVNDDSLEVVAMPFFPHAEAGSGSSISSVLPDDLADNMIICIRVDQIDCHVYVDGKLRVSYTTEDVNMYGKVTPRRYIFMPVTKSDAGKKMTMELSSTLGNTGSVDVTLYGDKYDVINELSKDSKADIIIAVIMLIICILCLIGGIILSIGLKSFVEITHLAIMGILASIWILCNAEVSQFYFKNMSAAMTIDYLMLMLLPFPFLFFMDIVQNRKYSTIYKIFEYIVVVECVVNAVLMITKTVDLSQMFMLIAGIFGSALIMILVTIFLDLFRHHNYSYSIIAFGIFAGIFATILQMLLFIFGGYSFGGKAVAIALLIILFTAIIDTFRKVKKIQTEKQMAIAQSKAESSFLANMSHEIRTPINAVLGLNEMVLRESNEPQILEYAKHIDNSGRILLAVINDILDFSKIRSGKMSIIDIHYSLNALIENVCEMIGSKVEEKELEFELIVDENIPNNLIGDEIRIKQVVINILNNAVKYTDKGKVTFRVTNSRLEEGSTLIRFEVSDTGRGIKEEDIDNLFDAFSRVDEKNNRAIEGTGLGLALVQELVTSMHGAVSVDSIYSQGSTFTVEIPQKKVDDVTIAEARSKAGNEGTIKKDSALFEAPTAKVLVVDDVKINLIVVKSLLKRTKVSVTAVLSGKECIAALRENKYDVVLLDHIMPQMDGVETLEIIKREELDKDTPIIALTANAISGSREKYLGYGFSDYLAKPVQGEALEAMLLEYIPQSKIEK